MMNDIFSYKYKKGNYEIYISKSKCDIISIKILKSKLTIFDLTHIKSEYIQILNLLFQIFIDINKIETNENQNEIEQIKSDIIDLKEEFVLLDENVIQKLIELGIITK